MSQASTFPQLAKYTAIKLLLLFLSVSCLSVSVLKAVQELQTVEPSESRVHRSSRVRPAGENIVSDGVLVTEQLLFKSLLLRISLNNLSLYRGFPLYLFFFQCVTRTFCS